jgi:hypothetical protein
MSRLEGRYTTKANSRTYGDGRQSRPRVVAHIAGRLSVDAGRRQLSVAGTESVSGKTAERHDWLIPMELA